MGREIKFRAWWVKDDGEDIVPMMVDNRHIFNYVDPLRAIEDGDIIVMQYTGLKDKNGKDIYEGDIVKRISMAPGGIDFTGEVVFAECQYWIETNGNGFPMFSEIDELEVLGNIYENSDLLNECNK